MKPMIQFYRATITIQLWSWFLKRRHINSYLPHRAVVKEESTTKSRPVFDTSKLAFAACIFVFTIEGNGNRNVELIIAKTRVAPMKLLTNLRLELMATTLGVKLPSSIASSIGVSQEKEHFWNDGTVVLSLIINPCP